MANVLAYVEIRDAIFEKTSREVLTAAHQLAATLGGQAHAVVLGAIGVKTTATELASYGAEKIFIYEGGIPEWKNNNYPIK